jgi:seryl-tRNA synthetase
MSAGDHHTATDRSLDTLGLGWLPSGQAVLSGALLALFEQVDAAFLQIAGRFGARELLFPPFIAADRLHKLDYFRSFPQLATFPVTLDEDTDSLAAFGAQPFAPSGDRLALPALAPVREVLTPAACYHVYAHEAGRQFSAPAFYTTRCLCFRRESHYEALRRQWSFNMRELVCVGSRDEVTGFLAQARTQLEELLQRASIDFSWALATDPFFQPATNPQYIAQRVNPTKFEAVFRGLALASANFHQDHFGAAFELKRDGRSAYSACLAIGLERWLFAIVSSHGTNPTAWPELRGDPPPHSRRMAQS